MSWSITLIGKPANVIAALEKNSEKLDGQSKIEYDAVLPHMIGIIKENYSDSAEPVVKITAAGHGYSINGENKQRQCTCNVELIYGTIV